MESMLLALGYVIAPATLLVCAVALWQGRDRRFARLARTYDGPRLDLMVAGAEFHLRRKGEDPRFVGGPLRVPGGILRDRKGDVLKLSISK